MVPAAPFCLLSLEHLRDAEPPGRGALAKGIGEGLGQGVRLVQSGFGPADVSQGGVHPAVANLAPENRSGIIGGSGNGQ